MRMKIFSARFRNVRSPVPRRTLKVYKLPKSIFVRGYYRLHIPPDSFSLSLQRECPTVRVRFNSYQNRSTSPPFIYISYPLIRQQFIDG